MAQVDSYNLDQKPDETMVQYYKRLAKTADQRMVRLEKASQEPYFKVATEWAYAKATRDILKWIPPGDNKSTKLRFNTKPPEGEDLIAKINDEIILSSLHHQNRIVINDIRRELTRSTKSMALTSHGSSWRNIGDSGQLSYGMQNLDSKQH